MAIRDRTIGESLAVVGTMIVLTPAIFCGLAVLMIPAYVIHGWVIVKIWGWFAVPTFGLPQISIPVAIGLEVLILALRPIYNPENKNDGRSSGEKLWGAFAAAYIGPFFLLGVAYVAHLYV